MDTNVLEGADWEREIFRALDRSEVMLMVLSEQALRSEWVLREFAYFHERGRPVVLAVREVTRAPTPTAFRELQQVDFTRPERFSGALYKLQRALWRYVTPGATRPEARQPLEPEMLPIPAREFLMGSDSARDAAGFGQRFAIHTVPTMVGRTVRRRPMSFASYGLVRSIAHPG